MVLDIASNMQAVQENIVNLALKSGRDPEEITLLVVSKGRSLEEILTSCQLGVCDFGENRLPEALEKMEKVSKNLRWHFIGNLQSKKVSKAIGKFCLLHSVDSFKLAELISLRSVDRGLVTNILLQANVSGETSKRGLSAEGWKSCFEEILSLKGICVKGLMTMAPNTDDREVIREAFSALRNLRKSLNALGGNLLELSMGMTNDYDIAIEEGATIVRIGSGIFS